MLKLIDEECRSASMRFLIAKDFFKGVPKEKITQVKKRIKYFYEELLANKELIFDIPKGFWVKKLDANLYEFRINSGDRVLFKFQEMNRLGYEKKSIFLLLFSVDHDRNVKLGLRQKKNAEKGEIYKFPERIEEEIKKNNLKSEIYNKINSKIVYEITSDDDLKQLLQSEKDYNLYYLNDEQYEILNRTLPQIVEGSAGSGKTTVAIRKAMELEERGNLEIAYVTFTKALRDEANRMYSNYRNKNYDEKVKFYSLEELYEKNLKKKPVNYKTFKKFIDNYNPTRPKNVEALEIYQEIRGTIKGSMGKEGVDNWERDLKKEMLPLEDYLQLKSKYTIYDKKIREGIYKVAKQYEEWLLTSQKSRNESYLDENDLARKIILSESPKFDCIICDEVQDLTETEIFMLQHLVKNKKNLFFSGDVHQIINPTYFSFSRLTTLFHREGYEKDKLVKNYRSQKKIVDLANKLSDLRGTYIGKLGDDYKEASILDGEAVYYTKKNIDFLRELKDNTAIILVPTQEIKSKLKREVPEISDKILTVQEIKGLEYDSVVLYDFGNEFKEHWNKIFTNQAKQNQLYRYYFNLLYVGITRAKIRLLLMESSYKNKLIENIKDSLTELTAEGRRNFTLKSGEEDFLKEGKKFLANGLYREAISAFEKAGAKKYLENAKIELEGEEFFDKNGTDKTITYIIENDDLLSKTLEKYVVIDSLGEYAFDKKNYEKAEKYYKISENNEKLSVIAEKKGKLELSYDYAIKSEIEELINKSKEKIDKNKKALKVVNSIITLSDKKIKTQKLSINEFENLSGEYIFNNQKKYLPEIFAILDGKIKFRNTEKLKKIPNIKSPTKLLRKLIYVDGGKVGIKFLIENYSNKLGVDVIVSNVDDGEIIAKLIKNPKKKIDIDKMFLLACAGNMLKNVKKILDLGANIEARDRQYNMTPLLIAIYNKNIELVKLLVEKGANLEKSFKIENQDLTPLNYSIKLENIEILKYLVEKGADIELNSPLTYAISSEKEKIVEYLISKGVKLEYLEDENCPLIKAVKSQNFEIINMLVKAGANLHCQKKKVTSMKVIIITKYIRGLKLFLEKGYKLNTEELKLLSKINDVEMTKIVLSHYNGQNYFEKIENIILKYKEKKNYSSDLYKKRNINSSIECKYNFKKYKAGRKFNKKKQKKN